VDLLPDSGIIHEVSDLRRCFYCYNFTTKVETLDGLHL
jgi:hypothetical protein